MFKRPKFSSRRFIKIAMQWKDGILLKPADWYVFLKIIAEQK